METQSQDTVLLRAFLGKCAHGKEQLGDLSPWTGSMSAASESVGTCSVWPQSPGREAGSGDPWLPLRSERTHLSASCRLPVPEDLASHLQNASMWMEAAEVAPGLPSHLGPFPLSHQEKAVLTGGAHAPSSRRSGCRPGRRGRAAPDCQSQALL